MKNYVSFVIVFSVSCVITISGVILFFKPIAEREEDILTLPSVVGLIYIGFCALIYIWAFKELRSSFKAALVLILPQMALIIDLMLRGDRGPMTALAGTTLLFVTWFVTAYVHNVYAKKSG